MKLDSVVEATPKDPPPGNSEAYSKSQKPKAESRKPKAESPTRE